MKKAIIFLILIFTSLTISASEEKVGTPWFRSSGDFAISKYKESSNIETVMNAVIGAENNNIIFFIMVKEKKCTEKDEHIMYFQDRAVKMKTRCSDAGSTVLMPVTRIGHDFIINKFISLNYVQIGSVRWNAKGFTDQYYRIKRNLEAL